MKTQPQDGALGRPAEGSKHAATSAPDFQLRECKSLDIGEMSSCHIDKDQLCLPRYLRRGSAARYVRERWGMPCQASWLAKLAVIGGGPVFRKCGRFPIYAIEDLDSWVQQRLSAPMRSTSEAK